MLGNSPHIGQPGSFSAINPQDRMVSKSSRLIFFSCIFFLSDVVILSIVLPVFLYKYFYKHLIGPGRWKRIFQLKMQRLSSTQYIERLYSIILSTQAKYSSLWAQVIKVQQNTELWFCLENYFFNIFNTQKMRWQSYVSILHSQTVSTTSSTDALWCTTWDHKALQLDIGISCNRTRSSD